MTWSSVQAGRSNCSYVYIDTENKCNATLFYLCWKLINQFWKIKSQEEFTGEIPKALIEDGRTKLKMEMENMSKRQQPDQREENSRGAPMGLW